MRCELKDLRGSHSNRGGAVAGVELAGMGWFQFGREEQLNRRAKLDNENNSTKLPPIRMSVRQRNEVNGTKFTFEVQLGFV